MAKVICTLPNASELISGVRFVSHKLGAISEEIEEDVAAGFARIRGYMLADKRGKPVEQEAPPAAVNPNADGTAPSNPAASADGAAANE